MKNFALVLSGGAAKGYAHIGVIKVLEKYGLKPDLIVGTSMGALVGGLYAAGKSVEELENLAMKIKGIGYFSLFSTLFKGNLLNINKIRKLLKTNLGDITHDDCKIKFVSVSTEFNTGKEKHFSSGRVYDSIMASISIPGIFPSVSIDGNTYCDGGALNNLPEDVARELMPDAIILSVDVIGDYVKQYEKGHMKMMDTLLNATTLMTSNVVKNKPLLADLRLTICQPTISQADFNSKSATKSIRKGELICEKHISEILTLLGVENGTKKRTRKPRAKN